MTGLPDSSNGKACCLIASEADLDVHGAGTTTRVGLLEEFKSIVIVEHLDRVIQSEELCSEADLDVHGAGTTGWVFGDSARASSSLSILIVSAKVRSSADRVLQMMELEAWPRTRRVR